MRTVTLEELLEAGCHFGHQVTRQNPKTRDFVFEARDNIHIIDLEKTKEGLEQAAAFVKSVAMKPDSTILILGTKRQADTIVKDEAKRAADEGVSGIYTVTSRWIGGTLTNFGEVTKNYKKLKDLTAKLKNELERMKYTKKEISLWEKERQKLISFYGGVQDMEKTPNLLFIVDTHTEDLAVREANAMGIPVVGVVDTNADPDPVKYVIPANDDAVGSIRIITSYIIDAWIEGKKKGADDEKKAANTDKEAKKPEEKSEKKETGEKPAEKKTVEKETKAEAKPKAAPKKTAEKKASK